MIVHLIDGTYELFRHFYGQRSFNKGKDKPFGAVVGALNGVLQMGQGNGGSVGRYLAYQRAVVNFRCLNVSKNTIANALVPTNGHFYLCNQIVVTF